MSRLLILCSVLAQIFAISSPVAAESLQFDAAVTRALAGNLELRAARLEIARAEGRLLQAGRLTNPELELLGRSERAISRGQGSTVGVSLAQSFPVTNRLALSRRVAQLDLEKAQAEVRDRERKIAGETAKAYVEAVRAAAREGQARQAQRLAVESRTTAEARFQGGQAPQAEAGLAELEAQRAEADAAVQNGETRAALSRLRERLGLPPGARIEVIESLDSIVARLGARSSGAIARADLQALGLAQEIAQTEKDLAAKEAVGDWRLSLGVESARKREGSERYERDRELALTLSVPLPLWNRNEGRQAELAASGLLARQEAEARIRQIGAAQEETRERIGGLRRQLDIIRLRTFPLLQKTETSLVEAYRSAGRDLTQLFLVRREHNAVHQAEITALAEIALQLVEAETQRGTHPALRLRPALRRTK